MTKDPWTYYTQRTLVVFYSEVESFDSLFFFFSSRRRHTRSDRDWSSDVCSSDLLERPRSIEALAPGYERVHAEAVARVRRLGADDLDRRLTYFDGKERPVRDLLRSEEHTSELQSRSDLVCRLLLEKKKTTRDT